jgi:hypothetical protein
VVLRPYSHPCPCIATYRENPDVPRIVIHTGATVGSPLPNEREFLEHAGYHLLWRQGEMKPNGLRQLLNEGRPTIGTHVISPWPGIVEIIGDSGAFDYIEYVGEYSPFSLE